MLTLLLLLLMLLLLLQSDSFSLAAIRELQYIYEYKGEYLLSRNLKRHVELASSREAAKKSGKEHGGTAWSKLFDVIRAGKEWDLINAAKQRKIELGLIRGPKPDQQQAWQAAEHQQQQAKQQQQPQASSPQQQRHSKQGQQQQQAKEADQLHGFDFSAAVQVVQADAVAAQQQAKGRRRRQQLQQ